MNELSLNIKQNPGVIELNFDEIEAALDQKLAEYKGAVFTEESKTYAKKGSGQPPEVQGEVRDCPQEREAGVDENRMTNLKKG